MELTYNGDFFLMDKYTNYIVSGLERSGTSLMMQILEAGGLPVAYDNSRKPDNHNPRGYYELEGGKIISKLMNGTFLMEKYKGKFIKITSWGLRYLPPGKYHIIYMIRDLDEIVKSTNKMAKEPYDEEKLRESLGKVNNIVFSELNEKKEREEINFDTIHYDLILSEDHVNSELGILECLFPEFNVKKAKKVIDPNLYKERWNG